jgi:hypothetical protein
MAQQKIYLCDLSWLQNTFKSVIQNPAFEAASQMLKKHFFVISTEGGNLVFRRTARSLAEFTRR